MPQPKPVTWGATVLTLEESSIVRHQPRPRPRSIKRPTTARYFVWTGVLAVAAALELSVWQGCRDRGFILASEARAAGIDTSVTSLCIPQPEPVDTFELVIGLVPEPGAPS